MNSTGGGTTSPIRHARNFTLATRRRLLDTAPVPADRGAHQYLRGIRPWLSAASTGRGRQGAAKAWGCLRNWRLEWPTGRSERLMSRPAPRQDPAMRRRWFTEEQLIGILKEADAGTKPGDGADGLRRDW